MALTWRTSACTLALVSCGALGCEQKPGDVALSRSEPVEIPDVPIPALDGPKLGAITHATPVRRRPARDALIVGYLHAGSTVPRAVEAYSHEGCSGGWYPIRPRGFVCLDEGASVDPKHPTLVTMAIQPSLESSMPYTYARTIKDTDVYEVDEKQERAVKVVGKAPGRSGMAIVGAWSADNGSGSQVPLAMMTNGQFLKAEDLEEAKFSAFRGVELNGSTQLPVAFIVKRGVFKFELTGPSIKRGDALEFHERLDLTGRYRTVQGDDFWELNDGSWVRHQDMTLIRARDDVPSFVTPDRKWVDVSVVMGSAVAYEGQVPVYATLISVGKDRLGEASEESAVTQRGEFPVVAKHVTALNAQVKGFANRVDIYDAPWTLELASGQLIHGSYWYKRFGIEHGPGNLQLSPEDARWLWLWASPIVPDGWHAVTDSSEDGEPTIINIHR